jgi:hypothetical protein
MLMGKVKREAPDRKNKWAKSLQFTKKKGKIPQFLQKMTADVCQAGEAVVLQFSGDCT